jgi:hypothetical protein
MSTVTLKTPEEAMLQINNIFVDNRKPEEIDLISAVRQILIQAGLAKECSDYFDTNTYIRDGMLLGPIGQRFLLNRFWNIQLMSLSLTNTLEERFCLIEDGSFDDWLRLFTSKILPCLITHRLPRQI